MVARLNLQNFIFLYEIGSSIVTTNNGLGKTTVSNGIETNLLNLMAKFKPCK